MMAKTFKKLFVSGLVVCLSVMLGVFVAACSDGSGNKDDNKDDVQTATKTYTVTFDVQQSTIENADAVIQGAPQAQKVEENGYATKPDTPVSNYTFEGWYKEAACTNEFVFTSEKITADTTVYAKWTAPECPTWDFEKVNHFYNTGFDGQIGGDAYSTENVWESVNNFVDPPVTTTYTYNHITLEAGDFVAVMWHLDGVVAGKTYKVDIRLGDEFKQDATVRAGLNMWIQDLESENNSGFAYSEIARKFGLIGLQIEFTEEQLESLKMGPNAMFKLIIQNPTEHDFDLRIVCAVGDAH